MPAIVISYRREDSRDITRRIYAALADRYGKNSVYIDIHDIPGGVDFRVHIRTAQEAFWKNYERLKAERLAREAAKSKEK